MGVGFQLRTVTLGSRRDLSIPYAVGFEVYHYQLPILHLHAVCHDLEDHLLPCG